MEECIAELFVSPRSSRCGGNFHVADQTYVPVPLVKETRSDQGNPPRAHFRLLQRFGGTVSQTIKDNVPVLKFNHLERNQLCTVWANPQFSVIALEVSALQVLEVQFVAGETTSSTGETSTVHEQVVVEIVEKIKVTLHATGYCGFWDSRLWTVPCVRLGEHRLPKRALKDVE